MAGDKAHRLRVIAVRERNAGVSRTTAGSGNTWHHFKWNIGCGEFFNFFTAATENKWVATFQAQHLVTGARFISPYYFSVIPERFKGSAEHGVNRMELGPKNAKDGSDQFYQAIIEFAKR